MLAGHKKRVGKYLNTVDDCDLFQMCNNFLLTAKEKWIVFKKMQKLIKVGLKQTS